MDTKIWVDDWQVQCCGDRFVVGDEVSWRTRAADSDWLEAVLGAEAARSIDAAEEHHSDAEDEDELTAAAGIVVSIEAVHCRYAPVPGEDQRALYPVPGSGSVTVVDATNGWTVDLDGRALQNSVWTLKVERAGRWPDGHRCTRTTISPSETRLHQ